MRTPLNNPFTPGADIPPQVWAGRLHHQDEWDGIIRPRRLAGLPERGRTILGEAGQGKSALVRRLAEHAAHAGDWVTPQLRIPTSADPLKIVASALLTLAERTDLATAREARVTRLLGRVETISALGMALSIRGEKGPEPHVALTELLVELGVAAMDRNQVIVVHIDEVQNITSPAALSQLLIALGDALAVEREIAAPGGVAVRRVLPIAVYLTGLPDFAELNDVRKGATFARRFATTYLDPLDDDDIRLALHPFVLEGWDVLGDDGRPARVHMTPDAIDMIVQMCCGEPFLFQLAGERAWYASSGPVINRSDVVAGWRQVRSEATSHVERILGRLPARERQLVDAMAALPPDERSASRIAREMGLGAAAQIGPTAQRLDTQRGILTRGKPYRFRHRALEAYLTSAWPDVGS